MNAALETLRRTTKDTHYEGRLFLVGGIVRDKVMGLPPSDDIDIVYEGNAADLAHFLHDAGVTEHHPVIYARFGTAMISVQGRQVELVSARSESYSPKSRKPDVEFATLEQDILRRDFTINTLLENLHTGEIQDITNKAFDDIKLGIIRTPVDPYATFDDDPLRMLRAVRFAARFGFQIEENTLAAIKNKADRLSIISFERIRDEFSKMLMTSGRVQAMEMLVSTGLMSQFAPELESMLGVTQNIYHLYDVWTHTMKALDALPDDAGLILRLAALFHDIGKPSVRSVDDKGQVHFYAHHHAGADITREVLTRLRYPNEVRDSVSKMVGMHLRVGEYDSDWSDAAVRRLIRDAGDDLDALFILTDADKSAANPAMPSADLDELKRRIVEVQQHVDVTTIRSPLNGIEIMELLGISEGPLLGKIKNHLINEIIEGRLMPDDTEHSKSLAFDLWRTESQK